MPHDAAILCASTNSWQTAQAQAGQVLSYRPLATLSTLLQLLDSLQVQKDPTSNHWLHEHLQLAQLRGAQVAAHARGRRNHQLAHQVLKALRPKQRREELGALRAAACL